jgi:hypothetical protein
MADAVLMTMQAASGKDFAVQHDGIRPVSEDGPAWASVADAAWFSFRERRPP